MTDDDSVRARARAPIPLTAPGGTVMAWACGHCCRVCGGASRLVDVYGAGDVEEMAGFSRRGAEMCCACRDCGGLHSSHGLPVDGRPPLTCAACWTPERRAEGDRLTAELRAECAAEDARSRESVGRSVDAAAALELRDLMSDLSEMYWCAGWLIGTEHELWRATAPLRSGGPPVPFAWGMGEVTTDYLARLHGLSTASGGWWHSDGDHVLIFVPAKEWEVMHAAAHPTA